MLVPHIEQTIVEIACEGGEIFEVAACGAVARQVEASLISGDPRTSARSKTAVWRTVSPERFADSYSSAASSALSSCRARACASRNETTTIGRLNTLERRSGRTCDTSDLSRRRSAGAGIRLGVPHEIPEGSGVEYVSRGRIETHHSTGANVAQREAAARPHPQLRPGASKGEQILSVVITRMAICRQQPVFTLH